MSALVHNAVRTRAESRNDVEWLTIRDAANNYFAVFMPLPLAEQIAEIFENCDDMCDECHRKPKLEDHALCNDCRAANWQAAAEMRETAEDDKAHAHSDLVAGA